ncbi:MAG: RNA-directed DNA polymerase [Bacteroidales bacterium]|nr:RNA-directed DNA polymerase [Bacteroidales bacterium]
MKRAGNLIEKISDYDNLRLAFYKAAKGKQAKKEVLDYRRNLDENLQKLSSQILSGDVSVGKYHSFRIFDPKERMIYAASFDERVLHHALMNICHPFFERNLIYDTYATRIGKGTYAALDRAVSFFNRYGYVAKLDVRKYFDSIRHDVLKQCVRHLFKDNVLLSIFDKIIDTYETVSGRGIPIGNLTSQYFANHYLSVIDHFAKENLFVSGYVRYMDDVLIFDDACDKLKVIVKKICAKANDEFGLEFKAPVFRSTRQPVSFLGYKLRRHCVSLNKRSRLRLKKKLCQYTTYLKEGEWSQNEYKVHVIPLLAFAQWAYCRKLRKQIIQRLEV